MRPAIPPEDRKVLEDWFDNLAGEVAAQWSRSQSETGPDLKLRLRKLERAKRALANGGVVWNPDMDVFEAVELRRQMALHDLEHVKNVLPEMEDRLQTERLWIMSVLAARLKKKGDPKWKGDRFEATKKTLSEKGFTMEAPAIAQRVRRWIEKVPRPVRRKRLYRILLSHFTPPSLTRWRDEHRDEKFTPVKLLGFRAVKHGKTIKLVDAGVPVFSEIENHEIALLKALLGSVRKRSQSSSLSTISSATRSASASDSSSAPVSSVYSSCRTAFSNSRRQTKSQSASSSISSSSRN